MAFFATCKRHGSMFYRNGIMADKVLLCENAHFRLFCSGDLDLDLMTFTYDLDPYSLGHILDA